MSYRFRVQLSYVFCGAVFIAALALALSWGWALASVVPEQHQGVAARGTYDVLNKNDKPLAIVSAVPDHDPHPSTEAIDAHHAEAFHDAETAILDDGVRASFGGADNSWGHTPRSVAGEPPRIAVIIDDMGLALGNSRSVVDLPAHLTLSFLPYASDIQGQVDRARAQGHEIMLHLPMEPLKQNLSAGPNAVVTGMGSDEIKRRVEVNLNAFTGYVGVNNHMGSRGTSNADVMNVVMRDIAARDVFFVDSWTSPRSVAYRVAADMNVPRGRRDIFLDHDVGVAAVWNALRQAERTARSHGSAVVIGHPRTDTITVLRAWLPMARGRGVQIVPMSQLVYRGDLAGDPVLMADVMRARSARSGGVSAPLKYDN